MTAPVIPRPWPGVLIRRRRSVPPTAAYLAERELLGIPSGAHALGRACPWCHASEWERCHVPGTTIYREPHEARTA